MSTPPTLSPADQARATDIVAAVNALRTALQQVAAQTNIPVGVLRKAVMDDFGQPAALAQALALLLHRRALMRGIWQKLSADERAALNLTSEVA
jgi:hypothetical protein